MRWTQFADGTIRIVRDASYAAYVHTDRSIVRVAPPGEAVRFYYHGPLSTGEVDPLLVRYDDGTVRKMVFPTGTPIEELHRAQPISEVWENSQGEEISPQDPQQYPFDELWRPPPPPEWDGSWPY
jgi:hypothetical protein